MIVVNDSGIYLSNGKGTTITLVGADVVVRERARNVHQNVVYHQGRELQNRG